MDIHIKMPLTDAGAKLLKMNAIPVDFYVLYKKVTTDTDDGYLFAGFYNPANEYNENYIAVPFGSTYDGQESWSAGTIFSNIIGSSQDDYQVYYDKKPKSWKELSKALGIPWRCLAERDKFYDINTQADFVPPIDWKRNPFKCNDKDEFKIIMEHCVVGGHVILEDSPREVEKGSSVYIVPICRHHNSVNVPHKDAMNNNTTPGNGNGFFMKLGCDTDVIKLKGYLIPPEQ